MQTIFGRFLVLMLCLSLVVDPSMAKGFHAPIPSRPAMMASTQTMMHTQAIPAAARFVRRALYMAPLMWPQLQAYEEKFQPDANSPSGIKTTIALLATTLTLWQFARRDPRLSRYKIQKMWKEYRRSIAIVATLNLLLGINIPLIVYGWHSAGSSILSALNQLTPINGMIDGMIAGSFIVLAILGLHDIEALLRRRDVHLTQNLERANLNLALEAIRRHAPAFAYGDSKAASEMYGNLKRVGQLAKPEDKEYIYTQFFTGMGPSYRMGVQFALRRWAPTDNDIRRVLNLLKEHIHKAPNQMGYRAWVQEWALRRQTPYVRIAAKDPPEDVFRKLRPLKAGHLIRTLESLVASTSQIAPRKIIESALLHLARQEPPLFTFKGSFRDFFGAVEEGPSGLVILLERSLRRNRIAVFHEVSEYLVKTKKMNLWMDGRTLIVEITFAGTSGALTIPLSEEALAVACSNSESPHYLLRALQRQVFPDEDRELSERLSRWQPIPTMSAVDREDTLEYLEFQIRRFMGLPEEVRAIARLFNLRPFLHDVRAQNLMAEVAAMAAKTTARARVADPELKALVLDLLPRTREVGPASQAIWQAISTLVAAKNPEDLPFFAELMPELFSRFPGSDFLNAASEICAVFVRDDSSGAAVSLYLQQLDALADEESRLFLLAMLLTQIKQQGTPAQLAPVIQRLPMFQTLWSQGGPLTRWLVFALGEAILERGTSADLATFREIFPKFIVDEEKRTVIFSPSRPENNAAPDGEIGALWPEMTASEDLESAEAAGLTDQRNKRKLKDFLLEFATMAGGGQTVESFADFLLEGGFGINEILFTFGLRAAKTWSHGPVTFVQVEDGPNVPEATWWCQRLAQAAAPLAFHIRLHTAGEHLVLMPAALERALPSRQLRFIIEHELHEINSGSHTIAISRLQNGCVTFNYLMHPILGILQSHAAFLRPERIVSVSIPPKRKKDLKRSA